MPANYVLLERIELNASAASITFANIPQSGYTDLKVVASARGDFAANLIGFYLQFNGSTANFSGRYLRGYSTGVDSGSIGGFLMDLPAASTTASTFGSYEIYIPNYTSSNNKSFSVDSASENNSGSAFAADLGFNAGLWSQTAAITNLTVYPDQGNFVANSTFSLYGLAALGTTPVIAPKASGGNRIDNDGTYWYHTFTSTGTFTPLQGLSADVLVVAGGGGGGASGDWGSGGGGAGGLLAFTSQSLSTTNYTCTVGAGGAVGANGGSSTFGALTTAVGGGAGARANVTAGQTGGSGGGGAYAIGNGLGTSGQGNDGGSGGSFGGAAGGGGKGAVGSNSSGSNDGGGAGGIGVNTYSSWASATATGDSGYYAGGGAGGAYNTSRATAAGGTGGGGTGGGSGNSTGNAGTTNTGGGAGGAVRQTTGNSGGSGIIIIRYTIA